MLRDFRNLGPLFIPDTALEMNDSSLGVDAASSVSSGSLSEDQELPEEQRTQNEEQQWPPEEQQGAGTNPSKIEDSRARCVRTPGSCNTGFAGRRYTASNK